MSTYYTTYPVSVPVETFRTAFELSDLWKIKASVSIIFSTPLTKELQELSEQRAAYRDADDREINEFCRYLSEYFNANFNNAGWRFRNMMLEPQRGRRKEMLLDCGGLRGFQDVDFDQLWQQIETAYQGDLGQIVRESREVSERYQTDYTQHREAFQASLDDFITRNGLFQDWTLLRNYDKFEMRQDVSIDEVVELEDVMAEFLPTVSEDWLEQISSDMGVRLTPSQPSGWIRVRKQGSPTGFPVQDQLSGAYLHVSGNSNYTGFTRYGGNQGAVESLEFFVAYLGVGLISEYEERHQLVGHTVGDLQSFLQQLQAVEDTADLDGTAERQAIMEDWGIYVSDSDVLFHLARLEDSWNNSHRLQLTIDNLADAVEDYDETFAPEEEENFN